MMHIPNRDCIARVHDPIGFRHVEVDVLVEGNGVRVAGWKIELRDHGSGNRHGRRKISVYMLNGTKEEKLVAGDSPSTVCEIRVQIDVRRCHGGREQLRTRAEGCATEDEPWRAKQHLLKWMNAAMRSRLEPFKKFTRMLRSHMDGVLAWTQARVSNGAVEG